MAKTDPINLSNVRPRLWLLDILPGTIYSGTALYPRAYVSRALYANLQSNAPNPYAVGLVLHEQEHLRRIQVHGTVKWYAHYLVSPWFRLTEELAAYRTQFAYLKHLGLTIDLERKARQLSSWVYLRPVTYDRAYKLITKLWNEV